MSELPEPIPAATLVLMREADGGGPPELLVTERTGSMAFAAGALVFPGGRIDEDDHVTAARLGGGVPDAAARIAAIRETIEETGIAPAIDPPPAPETVAELRAALAGGATVSELLDEAGIASGRSLIAGSARPSGRDGKAVCHVGARLRRAAFAPSGP